jgi:hypothetical protein
METAQVFYKIPDRFPHWPKIDPPFPIKEASDMFVKIVSHPPLGQPTVIPASCEEVPFRVALEVNANSEKSWEVILWHSSSGKWAEDKLVQIPDDQSIVRRLMLLSALHYSFR